MRQMDITFLVTHTDQSIFLGSQKETDFKLRFCDSQMMAVFPQESFTETSQGFFG